MGRIPRNKSKKMKKPKRKATVCPASIPEPVENDQEDLETNLPTTENCNQEAYRGQRAIAQIYKLIADCNTLKLFNPKNHKMVKPTAKFKKCQGVTLYYTLPTNEDLVQVEFKPSKKMTTKPVYKFCRNDEVSIPFPTETGNTSNDDPNASGGNSDDREIL